MAEDFLFPGVLLYLKDLGGYCQDEAEHGAEDSQHHNGSNDISDIHFPLASSYQTFKPEKPINARAIRPAVTRAMGKPSNALG